jgi:uncharacterized protein with FMN-binding domain
MGTHIGVLITGGYYMSKRFKEIQVIDEVRIVREPQTRAIYRMEYDDGTYMESEQATQSAALDDFAAQLRAWKVRTLEAMEVTERTLTQLYVMGAKRE